MKTLLFLSWLCAVMSNSIVGTENKITHSLAKNWGEVEPFKDSVYMPFFEKNGYKKSYLETRWTALEKFYKTNIARIILLKKNQDPIGFLTVEPKNENVLLYTSPLLIEPTEINSVVFNVVQDLYPKVTMAYCMAAQDNKNLQLFLTTLGWEKIEKSPIDPNKDFIENISFVVFFHEVQNSK